MWWPFRRRRPPAPDVYAAAVAAYHQFMATAQPTAAEAAALLRVWGFDAGSEITVFLVRSARVWRHKMLPEPEWALTLEDGAVLHAQAAERVALAVTKLAERLGVVL